MTGIQQSELARELLFKFPGRVHTLVPLSEFSRWRIGGPADIVVRPSSTAELSGIRRLLRARNAKSIIIGNTSNLLFSDKGLRAVCIVLGESFASFSSNGKAISAGARLWVPHLARRAMKSGLSGLEHVCGIPGSLGGLVFMNGGSQRKGVGELITTVTSVDIDGQKKVRSAHECAFSYRTSVFQSTNEIITRVELHLPHRKPPREIRREMLAILRNRRHKFPRKLPNCGSVFVSDPAMYNEYGPPGQIIEALGFKGMKRGAAQVSELHANFIVNKGGAQAADVLGLIHEIRDAVLAATGYALRAEVRYVFESGEMINADRVGGM